jgi:hypothetical protein
MIDLSKYVGKKVKCIFDTTTPPLVGTVSFTNPTHSLCDEYPYNIANWIFTSTGNGMSMPQIVTITEVSDMNGIAQRYPNINLNDFESQEVYVKFKSGKCLLRTLEKKSKNIFYIHALMEYKKNGTPSSPGLQSDDRWVIQEIYGEGAYEIKTRETFDEPTDIAVEKAKEAIKDLSEEQIAKLLHSLKK